MVPIALLYVKNWEEECCKQKKEEFREHDFVRSIQTVVRKIFKKSGITVENAIRETWKESAPFTEKNKNYKGI